jgi:hypothetical protein
MLKEVRKTDIVLAMTTKPTDETTRVLAKVIPAGSGKVTIGLKDGRTLSIREHKPMGRKALGKTPVLVSLYPETVKRTTAAAKAVGLSRSDWIEQALLKALEDL